MFVLKNSSIRNIRNFSTIASRILTSGFEDITIPKVTVDEFVYRKIAQWEDRDAVECGLSGKKFKYNELRFKANNLNKSLRKKLKLEKGDVVAILLPNVPEFTVTALALAEAGLVATTVNPLYKPDEICRQLLDSSAKAIITLGLLWPLALASVNVTQKHIPILTIKSQPDEGTPEGAINFAEFTDETIDYPEVNNRTSDDILILPYSSGTTGLPKGVALTHENIVSNICQLGHPLVSANIETTETHQDITPAVLPMFHIYGFTITCMFTTSIGAKVVTLPNFTPETYLGCLRKHRPQIIFLVPPIALFLANHPSVTTEDLQCLRNVTCGAAPLGALDEKKLVSKIGKDIKVLQGYGLTETSPAVLTSRLTDEFANIYGSLGKPVPNTEVKIVAVDDPTGTPLGPNENGELLVKGPQIMKYYQNKPDETRNAFLDGWFKTGDLMYYNDDGFLFITDRLKELIKVKGYQVAPAELEEIIRNHPDVAEVAVIGIPDTRNGELPRAYIVPKQGTKIDPIKIQQHVADKVAVYKQIEGGVAVVDSIPKNAAGKILRRELKKIYETEITQ